MHQEDLIGGGFEPDAMDPRDVTFALAGDRHVAPQRLAQDVAETQGGPRRRVLLAGMVRLVDERAVPFESREQRARLTYDPVEQIYTERKVRSIDQRPVGLLHDTT